MGSHCDKIRSLLENFISFQPVEFEEIKVMLMGFLIRRGWGSQYHDRMDIISEAVCRLWTACALSSTNAAKILSNPISFRCWLISTVRNVAHEQFRQLTSRKNLLDSLYTEELQRTCGGTCPKPSLEEIEVALMKCSAVSRLIVKLREEGESQESIAAMLGITRNKVRSYIAEAKEVLTIELDLECWDTESSSKFYQKPAEDHSMSGVACNRPRWSSKQGNNGGENHAHLPSNARAALLDLPRK